ncbi:hypothetical protein V8F20_012559 [Naviculisporaceae sp. PSN 640]
MQLGAASITSPRAIAAGSSSQVHDPNGEDASQEQNHDDEVHEDQRFRRSSRHKTIRRYHQLFAYDQDHEVHAGDQNAGKRKRAGPADGGAQTRPQKGKKKQRVTGDSSPEGPADARDPVEFDEVYAGGNATIKYNIAEYPKGSNQWWILRCLQHNKHFFRGALQAGAKHLSGRSHQLDRNQELAFNMFSVRVLNCDAEKAKLNNMAVKTAVNAGYTTPHEDGEDGERLARIAISSKSSQPSRQGGISSHVEGPLVGHIYQLDRLGTPCLAVVLPIGDLSRVGMTGDSGTCISLTSLGLKLPSCYYLQKSGVYRWRYHYRDGDDRVEHRKYPVMAFQEGMVIPPYPEPFRPPHGLECYKFPKASELVPVDLDKLVHGHIRGIEVAKAFHARMTALRENEKREELNGASGEDPLRNGEGSGRGDASNGDDAINGDRDAEQDWVNDSDSDGTTDGEDDEAINNGNTLAGADEEPTVQMNATNTNGNQPAGQGSLAHCQAGSSILATGPLETRRARSMTNTELADYLSDLHRDMGFGQDLSTARREPEEPGPDSTTSGPGPNGSNHIPRQPGPIKQESFPDSLTQTAPAVGSHMIPDSTAAQEEPHGLPTVIDLTFLDSPPSHDNLTGTEMTTQEHVASSTNESRFSPASLVKAAPFEPPEECWHIGRGGLTTFGANPGPPAPTASHLQSDEAGRVPSAYPGRSTLGRSPLAQFWHTNASPTSSTTPIGYMGGADRS